MTTAIRNNPAPSYPSISSAPPKPAPAQDTSLSDIARDVGSALLDQIVDSPLNPLYPVRKLPDASTIGGALNIVTSLATANEKLQELPVGSTLAVELTGDLAVDGPAGVSGQGTAEVTRTKEGFKVSSELRGGGHVGAADTNTEVFMRAMLGVKIEHDVKTASEVRSQLAKDALAAAPGVPSNVSLRDASAVETQFVFNGEVARALKHGGVAGYEAGIEGALESEVVGAVRVEKKPDGTFEAVFEKRIKVEGGLEGKIGNLSSGVGGELEVVERTSYALPKDWDMTKSTNPLEVLLAGKKGEVSSEIVMSAPGVEAKAEGRVSANDLYRAVRGEIRLPEGVVHAEVQKMTRSSTELSVGAPGAAHGSFESNASSPVGEPVEVKDPSQLARRFVAAANLDFLAGARVIGR